MKIEEFISKHKDQLDLDRPPEDTWSGISGQWKKDKAMPTTPWWKIAAIFFIITSFGLLIYTLTLRQQVESLASLSDISSEHQTIEQNYLREIAALEATIQIDEIKQNEDLTWLVEEMESLEEINKIYRKDIGKLSDEKQLVNVLIDYYEKKIRLLKKLELELKRTQKFKEDEKMDSATRSI